MDKELVVIAEESGLEKTQAQIILDNFTDFFERAKGYEKKAKLITISDISQKKEMQEAREMRLELKNIRVDAEKARKNLKERIVREGKVIDSIANVVKGLIEPIEEYLENQEKFAEIKEQERVEKINNERIVKLSEFVPDISVYNLREMSEEAFVNLFEISKVAFLAQKEAQEKFEKERLEQEKSEREERERIRLENEKLKKEAEAREEAILKERAEQQKKIDAERAKAKAEAEAREKIEKEVKEKEEIEKRKQEAEKKAKEELRKKAELAPDKDKLEQLALTIKSVEIPKNLSEDAQIIANSVEKKLLELSQEIKIKIIKL